MLNTEVFVKVFWHTKKPDTITAAKDFGHFLVGGEVSLVLGIYEVVRLNIEYSL